MFEWRSPRSGNVNPTHPPILRGVEITLFRSNLVLNMDEVPWGSHSTAKHSSTWSAPALWLRTALKRTSIWTLSATLLSSFSSSTVPHFVRLVRFWSNSPRSHRSQISLNKLGITIDAVAVVSWPRCFARRGEPNWRDSEFCEHREIGCQLAVMRTVIWRVPFKSL